MNDDSISAMCAAHGSVASAGRFPAGSVFGDWRVTAFIGRGGNGEVYCAEHVSLGTSAAVKVLVRDEQRAKERFSREAKVLSGLDSQSFPRFFSQGEARGCAYMVMELLEPRDLPSGDRKVARFLLHICEAVAELHARGIVHRDIKPGNILWRGATPVLADLGLVKAIATSEGGRPESETTLAGVGTPGYGAPEQMERGEASEASDIHALGVIADRCFGGKPPRAWKRIIERATSSIPGRRYPSACDLARAIRRRHRPEYMMFGLSVSIALAVTCVLLRERAADWWADLQERWRAPVLDASAVLDGAEVKDVRWFLDDLPVDLPHAFVPRPGDLPDWAPRRLCAVTWRDGKSYSAKRADVIPERWTGRKRLEIELAEDPSPGTVVEMYAQDGTPFEFAWCPPRSGAEAEPGFWISTRKLSKRQFAAIAKVYPGITVSNPFKAGEHPDSPVVLGFVGKGTVPKVALDGADIQLEPPYVRQWRRGRRFYVDQRAEMPEWAGVPRDPGERSFAAGGWMRMVGSGRESCIGNDELGSAGVRANPACVRYMAVSAFCRETNTVLYCTARSQLQSGSEAEVARGERLMKSFLLSEDRPFRDKVAEFCIEHGLSTLDELGGGRDSVRLRLAAVRRGDASELERLAAEDSDPDVRKAAYEALREPPAMVTARYAAQICIEYDPGDIGKPFNAVCALRDRAALEYVLEHGRMELFRDEARARLDELKKSE